MFCGCLENIKFKKVKNQARLRRKTVTLRQIVKTFDVDGLGVAKSQMSGLSRLKIVRKVRQVNPNKSDNTIEPCEALSFF